MKWEAVRMTRDGIVQKALREGKEDSSRICIISRDVCMCEYTSHGHCGILKGDYVDNDLTLEQTGTDCSFPGTGRC